MSAGGPTSGYRWPSPPRGLGTRTAEDWSLPAQPHERAGLLSVILIVGYLAFSLPTIVAGLFVPRLGLPLTLYIYGAAVIVLAAISLIAAALSVRRAA